MRNRSLFRSSPELVLIVVAVSIGAGCKDQAALDQLKRVKAELEEREDELDSAEKRTRTAEKDLEASKAELESIKARLAKETAERERLDARLKLCDSAPPTPTGSLGGECAAYFQFMDDCIPLLPAMVQSSMRDSVDTMKKALTMGGGLAGSAMEKACKPALDAMMKLPQCSALPKPKASPLAPPPCNCLPSDPLCSCL